MNRVCKIVIAPCGTPETGAALFVCLVFLLIMTIVGLAGMQNTSLQEKMAGHLRDSDLAFQAAESALKAGEASLANSIPAFVCTSATDGYYVNSNPGTTSDCSTYLGSPSNNQSSNPYPPENENFWICSSPTNCDMVILSSSQFKNLASPPKYVMEVLSPGAAALQTPAKGFEAGIAKTPQSYTYYRITAHGTGQTTNSVAVVQSVVKLVSPPPTN